MNKTYNEAKVKGAEMTSSTFLWHIPSLNFQMTINKQKLSDVLHSLEMCGLVSSLNWYRNA